MNKEIYIQNFKCFASAAKIEMARLTLCAGMNSMGKSTLIQTILLLRQTYDTIKKYSGTQRSEFIVFLNDRYALQLGDVNQIMSSTDSDIINIGADSVRFEYVRAKDMLSLSLKTNIQSEHMENYKGVFSPHFYYLNAERLGPRNYQAMESYEQAHCGFHGEHTFDMIYQNAQSRVTEKRCFPHNESKGVKTLEKQVEYWLDYIIPGTEVSFTSDLAMRLSQMTIRQTAFDTALQSPHNFGFGASYVLPIIVTGLLAEPDSMVIIENPEAHLHPAGQSRIGWFLSQVANDCVQVVIETHSEHVINGVRLHSLKNGVNPINLCINYFSMDHAREKHVVKRLHLNDCMDILEWPEGFFDQEAIDLKELRALRSVEKR